MKSKKIEIPKRPRRKFVPEKLIIDSWDKIKDLFENLINRDIARLIELEVASPNGTSLDQMITSAHNQYRLNIAPAQELLEMRSGSVCNCSTNNRGEIMDRITVIHNQLKKLEQAGHNGHFGSSCIGLAYWVTKLGI